jgi:nitrite reductase/ring-hydroxylating ferredoxin subunit
MGQISRRIFFLVLATVLPAIASDTAEASKTTKPTPTPTPKKKNPSTPSKTKTPTPSKSPTASPKASPSASKVTEGVVIAKSSDLAIRQIKIFFLKDSFGISTGYSLTRTSRGVVMAFDSKCTHAGAPTSVSGSQLKCPAHGSIFNPENGEVVSGPALEPLRSYRTIEANGEIRIVIS